MEKQRENYLPTEPDPAASSPTAPDEAVHGALATAIQRYRLLADNIPDIIYSLDEAGSIIDVNKAVIRYGYTVGELIGQDFTALIYFEDRDQVVAEISEIMSGGDSCSRTQKFRMISKSGEIRWIETSCFIKFGPQGRFMMHEGICRDITIAESGQSVEALMGPAMDIETLVRMRTAELIKANDELLREISDRRETERVLREREADLEMEKGNLQETNTALKVLLKRREIDRHEFEEQVMCNVKEFVLPYLDRLKDLVFDERQKAFLEILESNLSDVTSAFSRRLSLEYYNLTPSERKVANFIRQGKKTREIAVLLGLSPRTIETYRMSIRNKLRLQNKRINLRTFLLSIN